VILILLADRLFAMEALADVRYFVAGRRDVTIESHFGKAYWPRDESSRYYWNRSAILNCTVSVVGRAS